MMELGKSLEKLVKLKKLALVFECCSKIGEYKETSVKLGALVPKTAKLEKFVVVFRW